MRWEKYGNQNINNNQGLLHWNIYTLLLTVAHSKISNKNKNPNTNNNTQTHTKKNNEGLLIINKPEIQYDSYFDMS